jgi:hypothetical protein
VKRRPVEGQDRIGGARLETLAARRALPHVLAQSRQLGPAVEITGSELI